LASLRDSLAGKRDPSNVGGGPKKIRVSRKKRVPTSGQLKERPAPENIRNEFARPNCRNRPLDRETKGLVTYPETYSAVIQYLKKKKGPTSKPSRGKKSVESPGKVKQLHKNKEGS